MRNGILPDNTLAILFDAGNTLIHLDYSFVAQLLARYGARVTPEEVAFLETQVKQQEDWIEIPPPERWRIYWGNLLDRVGLRRDYTDAMLAEFVAEHQSRPTGLWCIPDPDIPDVLEALLQQGYRLGVISNADGRAEDYLQAHRLRGYFEVILDSDVVGIEKPDPRIFYLALERLGVEPSSAVYVGDIYPVDVRGARRAGLYPILYEPRWQPKTIDCVLIRRLRDLI